MPKLREHSVLGTRKIQSLKLDKTQVQYGSTMDFFLLFFAFNHEMGIQILTRSVTLWTKLDHSRLMATTVLINFISSW